ncbi:50S ribosomal protein L21 [Candidatus Gottesmanbacteria bacterium]|nr:50S ribosomal protein L21 [Candidatus Gottesmanbacteria bacterium]
MKYAIVKTGGKQYKVDEGQEFLFDKLAGDVGSNIEFSHVLFMRKDSDIKIGTPDVAGGKVVGKVISQLQGKKLSIFKFKAKVNYRRKMGFRPKLTRVKIETIVFPRDSSDSRKGEEPKKTLK